MAGLPYDINGSHTVFIYLVIFEPYLLSDVKCPNLRSLLIKQQALHNNELFMRSRILSFCSFDCLGFYKVIKHNFHNIELNNTSG